jgi:hypothetical protein
MKQYKIMPNTYVYPAVLEKFAVCFSVVSRPIETLAEYWEFDDTQFQLVAYNGIMGLEQYGTGAVGTYFWVRLTHPVKTKLNIVPYKERHTKSEKLKSFKVYGFYVHSSRVKTIEGDDVYDIIPPPISVAP